MASGPDLPSLLHIAATLASGLVGAVVGLERRMHHKPIGIAGMVMIGLGSAA